MKRLFGFALVLGAFFSLSGCVYGPGYYQRPGVVYDDGNATYSVAPAGAYGYDDGWYSPGYYYGNAYGPWCCYGGGFYPWLGVGFYGGYYHGYHGGGWHGGGGHWGGGHGGGHGGGGHGGHH